MNSTRLFKCLASLSILTLFVFVADGCSATAQDLGNSDGGNAKGDAGTQGSDAGLQVDPANLTHCQKVCLQFGPEACTRTCLGACVPSPGESSTCETRLTGLEPTKMQCATTNVSFYEGTNSLPLTGCSSYYQGKYTGPLPDGGWNQGKRIFVTSGEWAAMDIRSAGGTANGLTSADKLCQQEADAGGNGGTWKAWLSDGKTNASAHVEGDGPWYNGSRSAIVFRNRAGWSVGPMEPIGKGSSWTGSNANGTRNDASPNTSNFCEGWSTDVSFGFAVRGDATSVQSPKWANAGTRGCGNGSGHLYCFEQ